MMRAELSLMWDCCFDSVPLADCTEKPVRVVSVNAASARLLLAGEAQAGKRGASLLICMSGGFHK